ncbi:MAG: EAL domain-containing protein [Lachnospiraceae bacterium]|nr:EAL domain-containing protein [Lachnospiraceae bacterium]
MKIALIITVLIAITALIATATFFERWRAAQTLLSKKSKALAETEGKLRRAEDFGRDAAQERDRLREQTAELSAKCDRVSRMAYYDANTDLPNRQKLADEFREAMKLHREGEDIGFVIFEFHSREASAVSLLGRNNAEMRQEILQRLKNALNTEDDLLVSLSEDAFAVLTRRIAHRKDYEGKIDKLFKLLTLPVMSNGAEVLPIVYGAVVLAPEHGDTMQLLDMNLGLALREAQESPESRYCFYTEALASETMERMARRAMVADAVRAGRVEYPVTPRVEAASGRIIQLVITPALTTAEGVLSGRELLRQISDSGYAAVVYDAMVRRVLNGLRHCAEEGTEGITFVIPVTERMFADSELTKTTYDILQDLSYDARNVILEIPDQVLQRNPEEAAERMRRLANFGIRFAVVTDGLPECAASILTRLPVDLWVLSDAVGADAAGTEPGNAIAVLVQAAHAVGVGLAISGVGSEKAERAAVACGADVLQGSRYGDAMSDALAARLLSAMR